MSLTRTVVVVAGLCIAGAPGTAWCAGDRAAYEIEMADLAKTLTRQNPIAFLVGLGDWYCSAKAQQGGRPLDTWDAAAEIHRQHPEFLRSADDTVAQYIALEKAAKMLCPD